jgi:hypothetical protein
MFPAWKQVLMSSPVLLPRSVPLSLKYFLLKSSRKAARSFSTTGGMDPHPGAALLKRKGEGIHGYPVEE